MTVALLSHVDIHEAAPILEPLFDPSFEPPLHADQKFALHFSAAIQDGGQKRPIAMKPIG